jgi:1,4-dihydroxy-2-naphthoyl-CoA synthase
VVAIDYGVKLNILRSLEKRGCTILLLPADVDTGTINRLDPGVREDLRRERPDSIPQAIKFTKTMMNAHSDLMYPVQTLGFRAWTLLHGTDQWKEGFGAYLEKRKPDFSKFKSV